LVIALLAIALLWRRAVLLVVALLLRRPVLPFIPLLRRRTILLVKALGRRTGRRAVSVRLAAIAAPVVTRRRTGGCPSKC
jgi:hypothetical protein